MRSSTTVWPSASRVLAWALGYKTTMNFNLKDETSWEPIVRKKLNEILGSSYFRTIKEHADKIKYRDSEEEACNLFSHIIPTEEIVINLMQEFCKCFRTVTAYHACRAERVSSYYENGIIPLSPFEAQAQFRELFKSVASPEDIDNAIASVSTETRAGAVYTVLDDRVFYESSGHYLIYGGEYLYCLAIHLPGYRKNGEILKNKGKATVIICELPFSLIPGLEELTRFILADHFFRIAHKRDDVFISHFGIPFFSGKIHPKFVVNHYHLTRISDPFFHGSVWNDEQLIYE